MKNSDRFFFHDFTLENYLSLLNIAKEKYVFRSYNDFDEKENFILWRHDVDVSVHAARKIAQIEAEQEIKATYFFHLHNEFYNLLETEIALCVRDILALGHYLGLHFDASFFDIKNEQELERYLLLEKSFLESIFDCKILAFSFHFENDFATTCRKLYYAGLINANAEYFHDDVGFFSDSNGYWKNQRLEDFLREGTWSRLQILTHPEWWQDTVMSPKEKIFRCIDGRAAKTKQFYEKSLQATGRPNIDWD